MKLDEQEIIKQAITQYGVPRQMEQIIEECGELIVVIRHAMRGRKGVPDLIEELVDVEIMIEQMKLAYGGTIWSATRERKLERLKKRLRESEVVK